MIASLIVQYRTAEVERKPLHSGVGKHLEQLQPTSQGTEHRRTDIHKAKRRNRQKGLTGNHKGHTGKGLKHKNAYVEPHKAHRAKVQPQENADLEDHLSARDDSAEKFERSLDDIE